MHRILQAGTLCVVPSCHRGNATEAVLRALVERVLVPNTAAVAESSRRLDGEVARFVAAPSVVTLRAARAQWQRALLCWKRADVFRSGPIMDTNSLLRALFWPVRTGAIEALLQSSDAIDDASLDALGVDRRGLYALEYLLHAPAAEVELLAGFTGPGAERRARLARALAGNVSLQAERVTRSLGDGKKYADELADGGKESVGRVVKLLIDAVENVSVNRLGRVSALAIGGRLDSTEIEGGRGRMSQQIALTSLRASEQIYVAGDRGFCELVRARSPAADADLGAAFGRAIAALSSLDAPLEEVAKRDAAGLEPAANAVKKLERALKTELVSSLGVTLTFSALDGD